MRQALQSKKGKRRLALTCCEPVTIFIWYLGGGATGLETREGRNLQIERAVIRDLRGVVNSMCLPQ